MAAVTDLTKDELSAKIDDAALKTWWDATPAIPASLTSAELFSKLLKAAYVAQTAKNTAANATVGERLNSYPAPTAGAITTDTATGTQSYLNTSTVQVRVATSLDLAVATTV